MDFLLIFTFSQLLVLGFSSSVVQRDVCILGAGASGMFSAVTLKDRGYSVAVFENTPLPGGHCATDFYTPLSSTPLPNGDLANYVDLGVHIYPDTRLVRQAGIYPYNINTTDIIARFSSITPSTVAEDFSAPSRNFLVDYTPPQGFPAVIPEAPATLAQEEALGLALQELAGLLNSKYPWLNVPGYPDPIPAELLVPFSQWVTDNGFQALAPFFNQFVSGLGSYESVTALYALGILSPTVLFIFGVPGAAFHINGGCIQIYNGMSTFLGADVHYNFTTTSVQRPCGTGGGHCSNPSRTTTTLKGVNTFTGVASTFTCGQVIVSFAQTTSNLEAFDLDASEITLFNAVNVRHFWGGVITVSGANTTGAFNMNQADFSSPFLEPQYPGLILLNKEYAYLRPATFNLASPVYLPDAAALLLANLQLADLAFNKLINFGWQITDVDYHQYQPYVSGNDLSVSPNFYTRLRQKQGYRNTYHVGAATAYAGSYIVWESAYNLILANFPVKH